MAVLNGSPDSSVKLEAHIKSETKIEDAKDAADVKKSALPYPFAAMAKSSLKMDSSTSSLTPIVEQDPIEVDSDDSDNGVDICKTRRTHEIFSKQSQPPKCTPTSQRLSLEKGNAACPKPSCPDGRGNSKGRKAPKPKDRAPLIPGDSRIFSTRVGEHFMDGQSILSNFGKTYMPPWDDCIPSNQLSLDNMPPFFRRLRNDQVGHLVEWINDRSRVSITPANAYLYWPCDLTGQGGASSKRDRWGKTYAGKPAKPLLAGGPALPTYTDMGLPPTWTSSGKAMCPDPGESTGGTGNKRKADQMMDEGVDSNGKRFCVWAKPETPEDVIRAFTSSLKTLKEDHKTETEALKADITARDASIEALKVEKEIALEEINNHVKVLRDKDVAIEQLEIDGSSNKKVIDDLNLNIQDNKCAMDVLQCEKDNTLAQLTIRDQTIKDKDTAIESLNHTIEISSRDIAARNTTIAELQGTLKDEHTKIGKLEAKIKRLNSELQIHKTKHGEESRARQALEVKKKTELKDVRKDLRDATTKLKSHEATIAEKEKVVRDTKKHITQSNTKIQDLEAKIKLMEEVIAKNEQNYSKREERIKHLETKIGFFRRALDLCRELDEKEMGDVQGGRIEAEAQV